MRYQVLVMFCGSWHDPIGVSLTMDELATVDFFGLLVRFGSVLVREYNE